MRLEASWGHNKRRGSVVARLIYATTQYATPVLLFGLSCSTGVEDVDSAVEVAPKKMVAKESIGKVVV